MCAGLLLHQASEMLSHLTEGHVISKGRVNNRFFWRWVCCSLYLTERDPDGEDFRLATVGCALGAQEQSDSSCFTSPLWQVSLTWFCFCPWSVTLLTRVLSLDQSKLMRGQSRNLDKAFLLGLMLPQRGGKTNDRFPCLLACSPRWGKLVPYMGWQ